MNTVTVMNTAVRTASSVDLTAANDSVEKELSISTWRIAEMMGRENRHADIMRTVDRLVEAQVITKPPMAFWSKTDKLGRKGKNIDVYLLTERDSYVVIAQTDPVYTAMLVDEWQRLKKENEELKKNPYANLTKLEWMRKAVELEEEKEHLIKEKKQLIELHVRKSVDSHSMTRLLGAKKGATKVKEALTALRTAGYIERVYDENNKPCGYVANDSSLSFCRMNAHYQLEFTVDVLPVLVELGVLEEEQKATLNLPKPNNTILIQNKAAERLRQNAGSLEVFGL
ncbi:hypothetical protein [Escherichia coli]|uniref:hypothetical protein n=1 Tax=Escherichia coli TaxID=562 RepID=UPI0022FD47EB|nr:hypothetical protein [Escherichia coli]MDC9689295.1 hypothetical protein [Escherichia coli]WCA26546.1 hypothetical protein PHA55_09485 [Escherichia coli]